MGGGSRAIVCGVIDAGDAHGVYDKIRLYPAATPLPQSGGHPAATPLPQSGGHPVATPLPPPQSGGHSKVNYHGESQTYLSPATPS